MAKLMMDEVEDLLDRFHGFHDANYRGIHLVPPSVVDEKFSCVISLLAKDFRANRVVQAEFEIQGISEFRICYNENVDYPNVRDDIAIQDFEGRIFFDLGFSATQPQCPDDIRKSDIYFVGESISFVEELT